MTGENYHMTWGSYSVNATNLLTNLLSETNFADVTLVCDGGKLIKAHKAILGGSSHFLSNIIKSISHPHPVIYLSGIDHEDLQAIIDLIYLGKTDVVQDNLESFVKAADKLQIIGLTEEVDISIDKRDNDKPPIIDRIEIDESKAVKNNLPINKSRKPKENVDPAICSTQFETQRVYEPESKAPVRSPSVWQPHLDNQNRQIKVELKLPEKPLIVQSQNIHPFLCKRCPFISNNIEILDLHMAKYHGSVYSCDKCNLTVTSIDSLKRHNRTCTQQRLFCENQCGSQYKNYDALERHQKVCTFNVSNKK